MSPQALNTLMIIVFSVLSSIIGFSIKSLVTGLLSRINEIEDRAREGITEDKVRELMSDKLDPIKEDLSDIKVSVNKLSDSVLLLYKNKGNING